MFRIFATTSRFQLGNCIFNEPIPYDPESTNYFYSLITRMPPSETKINKGS